MENSITIYDIADVLNIDSSTVSRALNNSDRVGTKTKEKVRAMALKMGYQRNLIASSLRTKRTYTIGIVVPSISNSFYSKAIDGIEQIASKKGYNVLICQSQESLEKQKRIIETLYMNRIDGLIIAPINDFNDESHLDMFKKNNVPVVSFKNYSSGSNIPKVIIMDRKATYEITEYLISQGKRNILNITGNLNLSVYKERLKGFKNALFDNGVTYNEKWVKEVEQYDDVINELVLEINDNDVKPNAIICTNDNISVNKLLSIKQDLKLPKDLVIIGFSNEPTSNIESSRLTTIDQRPHDIGIESSKLLFEYIENTESEIPINKTVIIHPNLPLSYSGFKNVI